jgi:hypothetical protein
MCCIVPNDILALLYQIEKYDTDTQHIKILSSIDVCSSWMRFTHFL